MKYFFLIFSVLCLLFLTRCKNDAQEKLPTLIENTEPKFVDDPNAEITAADTSSTGVYQEEVIESEEAGLKEAMQATEKKEVTEDGALSFCDCVKKQKELLDLAEKTEDDDVLLKTMKELTNMKTGDCKILFAGNQSTIEEKEEHERKVKKCLNQR